MAALRNGAARPDETLIHATCVAVYGKGLLIRGASGSGKSALALNLMALGAALVADDQTLLWREGDGLFARCPQTLRGKIEARGLGILHADPAEQAEITLIVDLSRRETDRLPPQRSESLLGLLIPLALGQDGGHFPAMLLQLLRAGRHS